MRVSFDRSEKELKYNRYLNMRTAVKEQRL